MAQRQYTCDLSCSGLLSPRWRRASSRWLPLLILLAGVSPFLSARVALSNTAFGTGQRTASVAAGESHAYLAPCLSTASQALQGKHRPQETRQLGLDSLGAFSSSLQVFHWQEAASQAGSAARRPSTLVSWHVRLQI